MTPNVTIGPDNAGQPGTRAWNDSHRVFYVDTDGHLTLNALTVADGRALFSGGGIYNNQGALNVTNSTFTGNSATDGAASLILAYSMRPTAPLQATVRATMAVASITASAARLP